jgi:hypothetical protein
MLPTPTACDGGIEPRKTELRHEGNPFPFSIPPLQHIHECVAAEIERKGDELRVSQDGQLIKTSPAS